MVIYVQKERIHTEVPADLKKKVQIELLKQDKTLTDLIKELLEDWLEKQELESK